VGVLRSSIATQPPAPSPESSRLGESLNPSSVADFETKLLAASEALRRAEERATAGQLALEVIHEIRNPLQALGYLVFLTQQSAGDPDKVSGYMQAAEEQMATLNQIATGTLRLAKDSPSPQPVSVSVLTEAAIRIHQRTIDSKRARLVKDIREEIVVEAYTREILQVISNLIVNALDAIPETGTVHLRVRKSGGRVCILVADNGHGIPKENTPLLFQPFFSTKEGRGTGLGLCVSKRIIDHHNGTICVRSSVRPGRSGTAFRISLPAETLRPSL
jgi:signal transduction histidine kinase